jgi:hypothetical protein
VKGPGFQQGSGGCLAKKKNNDEETANNHDRADTMMEDETHL